MLGAGTAMVYPTLLAAVDDVAHPSWRARAVGVYWLWSDAGFAVGALVAGVLADLISITVAIWAIATPHRPVRMHRHHPDGRDPSSLILLPA
jgi:MFS family permease